MKIKLLFLTQGYKLANDLKNKKPKRIENTHQYKLLFSLAIDRYQSVLSFLFSLTDHLMIFSYTHNDMLVKHWCICIPPIFALRCKRDWFCNNSFLDLLAVHPLIIEVWKIDAVLVYNECTSSIFMNQSAAVKVLRS